MFKKRYGHYFDYFMMIIKHSRHPKLCCCLKIDYNELVFLFSLADSAVSSLKCKMQDQRITCDLVPLPPLLLLGEQLTDTESGDIEETEWEYSSQTDCASFTSDVSPIKNTYLTAKQYQPLIDANTDVSVQDLSLWLITNPSKYSLSQIFYLTVGSKIVQWLLCLLCLQGNQMTLITLNESIGYYKMSYKKLWLGPCIYCD